LRFAVPPRRNGFTTHTETSRGVGDQLGKRNASSIPNAMFYKSMFWDGWAATLEDQAMMPILNPVEIGQKDLKDLVAKLAAIPEFVAAFSRCSAARRTRKTWARHWLRSSGPGFQPKRLSTVFYVSQSTLTQSVRCGPRIPISAGKSGSKHWN
jgi:hypothetical protein